MTRITLSVTFAASFPSLQATLSTYETISPRANETPRIFLSAFGDLLDAQHSRADGHIKPLNIGTKRPHRHEQTQRNQRKKDGIFRSRWSIFRCEESPDPSPIRFHPLPPNLGFFFRAEWLALNFVTRRNCHTLTSNTIRTPANSSGEISQPITRLSAQLQATL